MTTLVNKNGIEFDIDDIVTDLNGKADVDLTNVNDSGTVRGASWVCPTTKYVEVTLQASDATYTAPALGYFYLDKVSSGVSQGLKFYNPTTGVGNKYLAVSNAQPVEGMSYLCRKGEEVALWYSLGGSTRKFYFVYAEGSKNEAE